MGEGGTVYILTNKNRTVLYTGATSDLVSRLIQHREKLFPDSFTARYNVDKLMYYEHFSSIVEALERERLLKAGSRKKKIKLIESMNPEWEDLYGMIKDW